MKPTLRSFLYIGLLSVCLPGSVSVRGADKATLQASALHGAIGGYNNAIATNSSSATISGGDSNAIRMDAPFSTIGGGRVNSIEAGSSAATIAGGMQNTIFGGVPYAAIAGGWVNSIQTNSFYAFIGGGFANVIGGDAHGATITGGATNRIGERAWNSVIAGGDENRVQERAYEAVISGGNQNTVGTNSPFAAIGGGLLNQAQAAYSTIAGGNGNHIQPGAFYGTIPGGLRAEAASFGQFAYAAGRFSANGDAQTSLYVLRQITTGPAVTELFLDGTARRMKVPAGGAWTFDILVVARSQTGGTSGFQVKGVIENDRNRTRLIGAPVITPLGAESGWKVAVEADTENEALVIKVVGQADTKIRWVANVRTVEVIY